MLEDTYERAQDRFADKYSTNLREPAVGAVLAAIALGVMTAVL